MVVFVTFYKKLYRVEEISLKIMYKKINLHPPPAGWRLRLTNNLNPHPAQQKYFKKNLHPLLGWRFTLLLVTNIICNPWARRAQYTMPPAQHLLPLSASPKGCRGAWGQSPQYTRPRALVTSNTNISRRLYSCAPQSFYYFYLVTCYFFLLSPWKGQRKK